VITGQRENDLRADALTLPARTVFTIVPVAANTLVAEFPGAGPDGVGRGHLLAGLRPVGAVALQ